MRIIKTKYFAVAILFSALFISCGKDPNSPGVEYMPDMYRSPSYETYSGNASFADSMSARMPVSGTVPRGFLPYAYQNDTGGYANAGKSLKNPLQYNENVMVQAEVLYQKYCTHCHGAAGGGDGLVGQKLPGAPPSFSTTLKDLPEGKIFHTITYGKGLMGAHAPLLTQEERWKLVYYVQKLQGKIQSTAAISDTSSIPAPPIADKTDIDNKGKAGEGK